MVIPHGKGYFTYVSDKGGRVEITPQPIFSLQLQNPSGHTGMLSGLVVDMIPLQNG